MNFFSKFFSCDNCTKQLEAIRNLIKAKISEEKVFKKEIRKEFSNIFTIELEKLNKELNSIKKEYEYYKKEQQRWQITTQEIYALKSLSKKESQIDSWQNRIIELESRFRDLRDK